MQTASSLNFFISRAVNYGHVRKELSIILLKRKQKLLTTAICGIRKFFCGYRKKTWLIYWFFIIIMRSTKNLGIFSISGWTWQFHTGMSWDNSQIGLMIKDLILEGTPHYKFEFRNQKYVRVDRHQQLFILSNPKSRRLVMRPLCGKREPIF